jgi:hypothetical protein
MSEGILGPMLRHLAKAALGPGNTHWLQPSEDELQQAAHQAGLSWQRVPTNLTPSNHRFSGILRPYD